MLYSPWITDGGKAAFSSRDAKVGGDLTGNRWAVDFDGVVDSAAPVYVPIVAVVCLTAAEVAVETVDSAAETLLLSLEAAGLSMKSVSMPAKMLNRVIKGYWSSDISLWKLKSCKTNL